MSGDPHPDRLGEDTPVPRRTPSLAVNDLLAAPLPAARPSQPTPPVRSYPMSAPPTASVNKPLPPTPTPAASSSGGSTNTSKRGQSRATKNPSTPAAPDSGVVYQYASVKQSLENRDHIEYDLTIREQPKHSRMCGVGEKADRRPIDPAPIIQLRIITHDGPPGKASAADDSNSGTDSSPAGRRGMDLARPPSGPGALRQGVPVKTAWGEGWEDKSWYLDNPYFFMFAILADADSDKELHLLQDGKTRYTTGSCVSSLYHLKDIDGSHQGFFVFPDLSIRVEGRYRLKLCLFETIGHEVYHCRSIFSAPFNVFTAKRFPGMEESTQLSKSFADQGLKLRVRKNPRLKRKTVPGTRPSGATATAATAEEGSEGSGDDSHARNPASKRPRAASRAYSGISGSGPSKRIASAPTDYAFRPPSQSGQHAPYPSTMRVDSSSRYAGDSGHFPPPSLPSGAGSHLPPQVQAHPFDHSAHPSLYAYRQDIHGTSSRPQSRDLRDTGLADQELSLVAGVGSGSRGSGVLYPSSASTSSSSSPSLPPWGSSARGPSFFDGSQPMASSDRQLPSLGAPPARRGDWMRMGESPVGGSAQISSRRGSIAHSSPYLPNYQGSGPMVGSEARQHVRTRSGSPATVHLPPPHLPPPQAASSHQVSYAGSAPAAQVVGWKPRASGWGHGSSVSMDAASDERAMQARRADLMLPPLAFGPSGGSGGGSSHAGVSAWERWDRDRSKDVGPPRSERERGWERSNDVPSQRDRERRMARDRASPPPRPSTSSYATARTDTWESSGSSVERERERDRGREREEERERARSQRDDR